MKICTHCYEEKPDAAFSKWSRARDGLRQWCKKCDAEYHARNREKHLKRFRAYYKLGKRMGVILVLVTFTAASHLDAAEPVDLETAILKLVAPRAKYKALLPYSSKRIEAYKSEAYRAELVAAFRLAADTFDLPVNLLIALGYRETVLRTNLVGPGGERGILQVMPKAIKKCKIYCGDVDSPSGGALCGACVFARGVKHCDDIPGAISLYVSGRCVPMAKRTKYAVRNRLWLWGYLNELTGEAK